MLPFARLCPPVLAAVALSACATPETRVRTALIDAGLSRPLAACMADRMVDRLSLVQLRRLDRLGTLRGANPRDLSVDDFLRRARALGDPEILAVVTTSAAVCQLNRMYQE